MKLIMHIGGHKSGSTTIQSGLKKNHKNLVEQRILYPTTALTICAHHNIPFSVKRQKIGFITKNGPESLEYYTNEMIKEAKVAEVETVVISSEEFITFSDSDIKSITSFLEIFDNVKVIAYLRNQIDLIESAYKFNVLWDATKETIPFKEYLSNNLHSKYHEYEKRLEPWMSAHANTDVVVKNFHDEIEKGLLENFIKEIGIGSVSNFLKDDEVVNPSLSRVGTLILRANNRESKYQRDALIKKIKALESSKFSNIKERLYTVEQLKETVERFFKSNKKLNDLFGVDLNASMSKIDSSLCYGEEYTDSDILNMLYQ